MPVAACFKTKFVAVQEIEEFVQVMPNEDPSFVDFILPIIVIKPIVINDSSSIDFIPSVLKDEVQDPLLKMFVSLAKFNLTFLFIDLARNYFCFDFSQLEVKFSPTRGE